MILYPRHFIRFLDGRAGDRVSIAFLPRDLRRYLPTVTSDISLGIEYARKLNIKHRMIHENFNYIQDAVDEGICLQHDDYRLAFLYQRDLIKEEYYYLLIKCAANGQELWLVTFHRITRKQFHSKLAERPAIERFRDDVLE